MTDTLKAMITDPNEIPVRTSPFIDLATRLLGGALTADGIQYSAEVTTTDADTDVEVLNVDIEPPMQGTLISLEFVLTAEFKAVSSATADLIWKWQARNKGGTWVDLHDAVTETDIGTTYIARTRSGYFQPAANLDSVPFQVRLILQCNEASQGRAKVKNSSYARAVYRSI